jgi:GTP-binding protein of the ras superfamily involved in termination of M-phase
MGKMMNAPIIFTSASHIINMKKVFKVVSSRYFNLKCNVPQVTTVGEALLVHTYPIIIPV